MRTDGSSGPGRIQGYNVTIQHNVMRDYLEALPGGCSLVVHMSAREVLIQDELKGLKPGSRVRWGMITSGEPRDLEGSAIELRQQDARLKLRILSPQGVKWQAISDQLNNVNETHTILIKDVHIDCNDVQLFADQAEHHRRMTFAEEFVLFLRKHGVEYDERYMWK